MSILKQVNCSSDFSSLVSVISYNTSVSLLLMHFLLWTKASHENINFDIFKCFDENLPNCLFFFKFYMTRQCHEIYSSVFFLGQIFYTLHRGTNQSANFLGFLVLGSKFTKFLSFLKQKISFSSNFAPLFGIMRHISSILFLAKTLYTFSKSSLLKYKFGEISPEQSKLWNFALWQKK